MLDVPCISEKFESCTTPPAQYLVVAHDIPMGIFVINGDITDWHPLNQRLSDQFTKSRYSDAPSVIYNLHPEQSFIGQELQVSTKRDYIGSGDENGLRCMSNIRLIRIDDSITKIFNRVPSPIDVIQGTLYDFCGENGVFEGRYEGPISMKGLSESIDGKFRKIWVEGLGHRFSGQRRKIPLSLDRNGNFTTASDNTPFTHMGKFPQIGGHESLAITEYMGLSAARAAGLRVAPFALISQGGDLPPMFVTERFDIAENDEEAKKSLIVMQDFYSLYGEDPEKATNSTGSYESFLSRWKHILRDQPEAEILHEMREAFTSVLVSYVVNDGDKHPKNFSTLKEVHKDNLTVKNLAFAPTFDVVCDVVCGRDGSEMFFKLRDKMQGRPKTLHMDDWLNLLKSSSLRVGDREYGLFDTKEEAEDFVREVAQSAAEAVIDIQKNPPSVCSDNAFSEMMQHDMKVAAAIAKTRAEDLGVTGLELDFDVDLMWKINKKFGAKVRSQIMERGSAENFLKTFNVDIREGCGYALIAAQ